MGMLLWLFVALVLVGGGVFIAAMIGKARERRRVEEAQARAAVEGQRRAYRPPLIFTPPVAATPTPAPTPQVVHHDSGFNPLLAGFIGYELGRSDSGGHQPAEPAPSFEAGGGSFGGGGASSDWGSSDSPSSGDSGGSSDSGSSDGGGSSSGC